MNYKKLFRIEIFFKLFSKIAGFARTLLVLGLFGFSSALDTHYLALSYIGILLSISVLFELLHMKDITKILKKNKIDILGKLFYRLIILSAILGIFILGFIYLLLDLQVFYHAIILEFWSIFFIANSFLILILRINLKYKEVGLYFFYTPLIVLSIILIEYYVIGYASSLLISFAILLSEVFLFIKYYNNVNVLFLKEYRSFNLDLKLKKKYIINLTHSVGLIVCVYLIDITDKYFSSIIGEGYTTVLTYGMWLPLMIRQVLDLKSVFYHKLQSSLSIQEDMNILFVTIKWIVYIVFPIIILFIAMYTFLDYESIRDFVNINYEQYNDLLRVFLIYSFILPIYIVWDMLYRIFYKNNILNKLFFIMFSGVFLNGILNFIFINSFHMKATGIALSTLLAMSFYVFTSFIILIKVKVKNVQ